MNVSDKTQDKVKAVRGWLACVTVPCPEGSPGSGFAHTPTICTICGGSGMLLDPAYAGLRELVEHAVPLGKSEAAKQLIAEHCQPVSLSEVSRRAEQIDSERFKVVTRDWTHSLSGSLYGAAMERLEATREDGEMVFEIDFLLGIRHTFEKEARRTHDRDLAIMTALEAALTAQLEAANARVG